MECLGYTWECYTCYTCMIIVPSAAMVVGDRGGKGMNDKCKSNDIKGNGNDGGKGMKGKGKCNNIIKSNGNDGGKGNDDGGRLAARGLKRPRE